MVQVCEWLRFDSCMIQIGYNHCEYDCCVYAKALEDGSNHLCYFTRMICQSLLRACVRLTS